MKLDAITQYSRLGRQIDPTYRPNLLILILAPLSAVVAFVAALVSGMALIDALLAGFFTATATFSTWGLSREVDPDHDWSAFVSVALVWAAMLVYRAPIIGLLSLGLILYTLRIINRIIGPPPLLPDSIMALVGIGLTALFNNWIVTVIVIVALLLDGLIINPLRRHLGFAVLGAVILIVRLVLLDIGEPSAMSNFHLVGVIGISLLYFLTIAATRVLQSGTDIAGYTLDVRRVRAAMILALAAGLISALWNGDDGVIWLLPLWCAMLGTALYRIPVTVREWLAYQRHKAEKPDIVG